VWFISLIANGDVWHPSDRVPWFFRRPGPPAAEHVRRFIEISSIKFELIVAGGGRFSGGNAEEIQATASLWMLERADDPLVGAG
jgi:hypothetical protein